MAKISAKESIARLVMICKLKGLKHVIISPGSRNSPLTLSFAEDPHFTCFNIPDERVAAFFAMGISQYTRVPAILCCTSGTAVLNYAPAIAEAFYQKIPLLVLTADRPIEWQEQRAGQTMNQRNVYQNYIKASYEIMEEATQPEHLWYNDRIVNEAIIESVAPAFGPVHINLPLREPLYDLTDASGITDPKVIQTSPLQVTLSDLALQDLLSEWRTTKSVLVIIGQKNPDSAFDSIIETLASLPHVVVMTETTSNVHASGVLGSIDRAIDSITSKDYGALTPDLLITCGASIISKKIRFMLRAMKIESHWHVDPSDKIVDTYQALTRLISVSPDYFLDKLSAAEISTELVSFKKNWFAREQKTKRRHNEYLKKCVWSDLNVISKVVGSIPPGVLHSASSTPIRYLQLFDQRSDLIYHCNRGVSGIDGCTSTAAGYAYLCNEIVTLITGDIAFFYDSNALWHHHLVDNFYIILINNSGGNIFRYVKGPDRTNHLEQHFEATHNTSAKHLAETYGIRYYKACDEVGLETGLSKLYDKEVNGPGLLEIFTPRTENIDILKEYFNFLKEDS